jgi:hypothetical protein
VVQSGRSMLCKSHRKFSAFAGFVQIGGSAGRKVRKNRSPRLTSRPIDFLHTEVRVNRFRLSFVVFGVACLLAVNLKSGADKRPVGSGTYSPSGMQTLHQGLGLCSELPARANSVQELPKLGMGQALTFFAWPQSSKVSSAPLSSWPGSIAATTQQSSLVKNSKSPTNRLFKCLKRLRRLCRCIPPRTTRPARKSRQTIRTK